MKALHCFLLLVVLFVAALFSRSGRTDSAGVANALEYPNVDFTDEAKYRNIEIVDGDTIRIKRVGKNESVRFVGVDTPETVHPNKSVEPFGEAATGFTRNLLIGELVYLRFDTQKRDMYKRSLAYVFRAPDGLFVNLEIIRQGYGRAYVRIPLEHMSLFQHYETQARSSRIGLWNTTR